MINSRASRSISLVLVSVLLTLGFMSLSLQKALASPNEVVVCSKSNRGTLGNDTSIFVSMNARGNEVAFQSDATNLRYMNPTSGTQVFYKNLDNHRVVECSSSTSGVEGNGTSQSPFHQRRREVRRLGLRRPPTSSTAPQLPTFRYIVKM